MTVFSNNPYDRRIERLMMTVPNFAPKGVGFRFTAERKARGYMRFVRVCYPADIRQGKSNLNRLRFFFLL